MIGAEAQEGDVRRAGTVRAARPLGVLKETAKRAFPNAYASYLRWQYKRRPLAARVDPILRSILPAATYDEEFDALQDSHAKWWDEYGYDRYSTWKRGCERAIKLLTLVSELRTQQLAIFEAGCGDGMTSRALASYIGETGRVIVNDTDDWRDERAKSLSFVRGDICDRLPLPPESFDLAITYNTFEHIANPRAALEELVRLCKSGGHIFIDFAPLYCSPLGLHAFSFRMPYPQFLFSAPMIEKKVKELGVEDLGGTHDVLQPTNKWRIAQFRELWYSSGCDVVSLTEEFDDRHLAVVTQYPRAFSGRGLTLDDLLVWGVSVLLRKR